MLLDLNSSPPEMLDLNFRPEHDKSDLSLGRVVGFVAVELARTPLQDLHGAPISPSASRRGARAHGRRDVSAALLGPRAVFHRRREGRGLAAVQVQLAAELPDARLEQVEAASSCCGGAAVAAEAKRRGWHLPPRSRRRRRRAASAPASPPSDPASPPPNLARNSHPVEKIEVFSRI